MNGQELMDKVKNEIGFTISPDMLPVLGITVYAGKSSIFDLKGNRLRAATTDDIKKWNTAWENAIKKPT